MKGKVAIVTGGSRDIGRQASLKLAADGANVCVNYSGNKALANETIQLIKKDGKHNESNITLCEWAILATLIIYILIK